MFKAAPPTTSDQRLAQALIEDPTGISLINKYFESLLFYKVEEKDGFAVYVARIADQLLKDGSKYVLAFVPLHLGIATRARLSELAWQNLQTRTIAHSYRVPPQRWVIPSGVPYLKFTLVSRSATHSTYEGAQVPFEMLLMHDEKKKSKLQYYPTVYLPAMFDSYGCVLHYVGTEHPLGVVIPPDTCPNLNVDDNFQLLS